MLRRRERAPREPELLVILPLELTLVFIAVVFFMLFSSTFIFKFFRALKGLFAVLLLVMITFYLLELIFRKIRILAPSVTRATRESIKYVQTNIYKLIGAYHIELTEGYLNTWVHTYLLRSSKNGECGICWDDNFDHRMIYFSECQHGICLPCARMYLRSEVDMSVGEGFSCPLEADCPKLCESDIRRVTNYHFDLKELVEKKFVREGLQDLGNVVQCPSTNCLNAQFAENQLAEEHFYISKAQRLLSGHPWLAYTVSDSGVDLRKFKCIECGYSYCVLCLRVWDQGEIVHDNISCRKYEQRRERAGYINAGQNDKAMRTWARKGSAKRCPGPDCGIYVQKNGGCNHMRCNKCGHHWCWNCQRYYPVECQGFCVPRNCAIM